MAYSYTDKNVLITGGSKGIGKAIARELLSRGANVILMARGAIALEETREELASSFPEGIVRTVQGDVSSVDDVKRAVGQAVEAVGTLHGVINNAGGAAPRYFEEISPEEFEEIVRIDYLGCVYVTQAALPHVEPGGFITFTSSVAGYIGTFGYTSYSPAKFAQIGFAEALDQELLSRDIRVAVLCPPDTETPGYAEENKIKPFETAEMSKTASLMQPEDVARSFANGVARGKFIINCNFESRVLYRLKGIAPGLSRWIVRYLVRSAQRKKPIQNENA